MKVAFGDLDQDAFGEHRNAAQLDEHHRARMTDVLQRRDQEGAGRHHQPRGTGTGTSRTR